MKIRKKGKGLDSKREYTIKTFFKRRNSNFIRIFKSKEKFTGLADSKHMERLYFILRIRFFV